MLTIIVFLLILGVLIFVHELGHFIVAVKNGIRADEFGFGFPPRALGIFKNQKTGKHQFVLGNKKIESINTIYSLNWIPLGGFVKIKGEDGSSEREEDSFAAKSHWVRIKVLAAGVFMNFVLAWLVISIIFTLGAPQPKNEANAKFAISENSKVQVMEVRKDSSAEQIGLKVGDEILGFCDVQTKSCKRIKSISDVQGLSKENIGKEVAVKIKRGKSELDLVGKIEKNYPENEGPLGVSLVETIIVAYPWYRSVWEGLIATYDMTITILLALFFMVRDLIFGHGVSMDVSGPIGIAVLTKQVTELGFTYILQFMAILSINLGIINILPFPALDGGRILFVIIEKIKGSPVSQKVEGIAHTAGFALLMVLMVVVTARDIMKLDMIEKLKNLF